jgi:hypothetical protein
MQDAWGDANRNPWTSHMSNADFTQIHSMLHVNNNDDSSGLRQDFLHKIRPLLNMLKKLLVDIPHMVGGIF